MLNFRFSVDDNIWVFRDLARGDYKSIFHHPYLKMYKDLNEKYGLKVQLNLFYKTDGFTLSEMPDTYKDEWIKNSSWLKLTFHARSEAPARLYASAGYDEVYEDCMALHREVIRFAGEESLSKTITVHFAAATLDGCLALRDCGVTAIAGLYGTPEKLRKSYYHDESVNKHMFENCFYKDNGIVFTNIDLVINTCNLDEVEDLLRPKIGRELIEIMIHEQYFYDYFKSYQPDFKEKVEKSVKFLIDNGYKSIFLEEVI